MKNNKIENKIYSAIKSVVKQKKNITLHEPLLGAREKFHINKCLKINMVSSIGEYVVKFEKKISNFTKSKYAIAVVNGTSGLHLSLESLNINHKCEVLVPAMTFVATANSVKHCGATPHFIDIEKESLGIDVNKLRKYLKRISIQRNKQCINLKTKKIIKAIIPVHVFGHPSKMDEIKSLSKEFNLKIIEDATESLGSFYKKKHTGTFGSFGVLSFNGNKIITTGGGGVVLTNSKKLAKRAKHLATTAKRPHKWEYIHDDVGYNYRMPNINAALGYGQIENLKNILIKKRNLFKRYKIAFSKIKNIKIIDEPKNCKSNFWLNTIVLNKKLISKRNTILKNLNKSGIRARPAWNLLNTLKPFKNSPRMDLKNAQHISKSLINIPSSYFL